MARGGENSGNPDPPTPKSGKSLRQRLVTGMSFVGQWENRWLAILRHAHKRKHVLYFDDLLGLFQAGITSQSNLSAADILKPYVGAARGPPAGGNDAGASTGIARA